MTNTVTRQDVAKALVTKAASDNGFLQALLKDPQAAINADPQLKSSINSLPKTATQDCNGITCLLITC